jgi:predicted O-methyltransferase YrrM
MVSNTLSFMRSSDFFNHAIKLLKQYRNTFAHIIVSVSLKKSTEPVYTRDWHSRSITVWNEFLSHLIGLPNTHALEIGTFEGRSALWLLEKVFTDPSSSISCIDFFQRPGQEARFQHNISSKKKASQILHYKGNSHNILPELTHNYFDLIYIDGSHDAASVLLDAFLSWPLLKSGGILIFDDYLMSRNAPVSHTPKLAIDIFLKHHAEKCEVLHCEYQVILRKSYD